MFFKINLLLFFIVAPLGISYAGSFAGNGSDDLSKEWNSAFFLGDKKILWCIYPQGDIGVSRETVQKEIEWAFEKMRKYLQGKGLTTPTNGNENVPPLLFNTEFQEQCDDRTALTFYLNYADAAIEEWQKRYANPLGFVRILSYDKDIGFGKGYVWIKGGERSDGKSKTELPDWSHLPNLRGILLHEMGHLLGCGHIPGTIMTADLPKIILSARTPKNLKPLAEMNDASMPNLESYLEARTHILSHVDYSRELFFQPDTGINLYRLYERDEHTKSEYQATASVFKRLTGNEPRGKELFAKFRHYYGANEKDEVFANFFFADGHTKDDIWRLKIRFAPIQREDQKALDEQHIFRRSFKGNVYPHFNPSAIRYGVIEEIFHKGKVEKVHFRVEYIRNIGRFDLASNWNKSLVQLKIHFNDSEPAMFFNALFDQQAEFKDGFYNLIGGNPLQDLL